jgi:CheY-like chemotaxis protein
MLDSRPGEGTKVVILLPRTEADAVAPEPVAETGLDERRRGTILVVDDQDDVREVAVAHLDALGYETLAAASGKAALDLLGSGMKIDLVLLDYAMPDMSGADVAAVVRQTQPDLPIILLSGYADAGVLEDRLRGTPVLRKPYRIYELATKVDSVLRATTTP